MLSYDKHEELGGLTCKCGGKNHTTMARPLTLPKLFMIRLCRFYSGYNKIVKQTDIVLLPVGEMPITTSEGPCKCRVESVIYHSGVNTNSGHYLTISQDAEDSEKWIKWDDCRRSEVTIEKVVVSHVVAVLCAYTTQGPDERGVRIDPEAHWQDT